MTNRPGILALPGPHQLPERARIQTAVHGWPIHHGPQTDIVFIQDPGSGWCIYPGFDEGKAWRISRRQAFHLAAFLIEHELPAQSGDEIGRFL